MAQTILYYTLGGGLNKYQAYAVDAVDGAADARRCIPTKNAPILSTSNSNMQIRPCSIDGRFQVQINGIGKKSSGHGEKFSQSELKAGSGDWAGQVEGNWMGKKLGLIGNVKC